MPINESWLNSPYSYPQFLMNGYQSAPELNPYGQGTQVMPWYQAMGAMGGGDNSGNPFSGALTGAAAGGATFGPVGAAIGGGLGLLGGILGGFASGKKEKQRKKEKERMIQRAEQLFPDMSKESFMFQSPELNNAIQSALAYRLQNMFGDWGMPAGRTGGMGSLNDIFGSLFNPQPAGPGVPTRPQPSGTRTRRSITPKNSRRGADGWMGDFERESPYNMM